MLSEENQMGYCMKLFLFLGVAFSLSLINACGSGAGTSSTPAPTGAAEGGMTREQAKSRWPGDGSYSNSFSNNGCTDTYNFDNQADYCMALTDDSLAKCESSNVDSRKQAYVDHCGEDFAQRNLKSPFGVSGFDAHLRKYCNVSSDKRYPNVKQLCDYYKDEVINNGCFWERRKEFFEKYKCVGEFSPQPAKVNESPSAAQSTPSPAVSSDPWSIVSAKYKTVGIELNRANQHFHDPSSPSQSSLVQAFIPVLADTLPDFEKRQSTIEKISVGQYTSYDYSGKTLTIAADFDKKNVLSYLIFHDQRIDLIKRSGIEFDFGVEIPRSAKGVLERQAAIEDRQDDVTLFKSKLSDLKVVAPLITSISLDSSNTVRFFSNTWLLSYENYLNEFVVQLPILKPLGILAGVGIEFEDYVHMSEDQAGLSLFSKWAAANSKAISELKALYGELTISINLKESESSAVFHSDIKKLRIKVGSSAINIAGLKTLLALVPTLRNLNYPVDIQDSDLGSDFEKSAKLFVGATAKIASLKGKIKEIKLGGSSSDYYSGKLIISQNSTATDLDKILNAIK